MKLGKSLILLTAVVFSTVFAKVKEEWVVRYDGPGGGKAVSSAVAVDGEGNVYVAGSSFDSITDYDYVTAKYSQHGEEEWVARYDGSGGADEAYALALDVSGNAYVTGKSSGSLFNDDYVTVKYTPEGKEEWAVRYNSHGNAADRARDLAVDSLGNVYVAGYSLGSTLSFEYCIVKYNLQGQEQWVARYNGPGNGSDGATALTIDISGNVYVTGICRDSISGNDFCTIKYDQEGREEWVVRYNSSEKNDDTAENLFVDNKGNVYVTGSSGNLTSGYEYTTVKYNTHGETEWVARYRQPGNLWNKAKALVVDTSGNTYVTGASKKHNGDYDYVTIKYNIDGEAEWVVRYDGPGNQADEPEDIALDPKGNVYVTGLSVDRNSDADYCTIKYNPEGQEQWVARYKGKGESKDRATCLFVDAFFNVYVTGSCNGSFCTVKYSQR